MFSAALNIPVVTSIYFFRKGYREGRWGFTIALMAALFPLIAHLKAELEQTACLDDKEKNDR